MLQRGEIVFYPLPEIPAQHDDRAQARPDPEAEGTVRAQILPVPRPAEIERERAAHAPERQAARTGLEAED